MHLDQCLRTKNPLVVAFVPGHPSLSTLKNTRRAHARTRTRTTNKALKKPKPRSQEDEERHKDVASAKQGFLFPYHFLSLLQVSSISVSYIFISLFFYPSNPRNY